MKTLCLLFLVLVSLLCYYSYNLGYMSAEKEKVVVKYRNNNIEALLKSDIKSCEVLNSTCVIDIAIYNNSVFYKVVPKPQILLLQ